MPAAAVLYKITNLGIHTPPSICSYKPTAPELALLSKGLHFVPTASPIPSLELQNSLKEFVSNLYQETSYSSVFKQLDSSLSKITSAAKAAELPAHNLTDQEITAIHSLRSNPDIKICPADKNLGTVIVDTKWYRSEVLRQLNDVKTYERPNLSPSSSYTLSRLQRDVSFFISSLDLPPTTKQALLYNLESSRFPQFYILPKVHKSPILGRPIVAAHSAPTTSLSRWVDRQLKRLLPVIPTFVKGSLDVLQKLKEFEIRPRAISKDPVINSLPKGLCLFAADVSSLYPSIPQQKGVAAVREFLRVNAMGNPDPRFRIEETRIPTICAALEFVLQNNYFTFEDDLFHQLIGTAMGTNLAPSFATIFLHQYEMGFFWKYRHIFPFVVRFIDDFFGVSLTTPEETKRLIKSELEQPTNGIILTVETGHSVPFLDLQISILGGQLSTRLFQKDLNLFLYNPYTSYQPRSVKIGLIKGEVIRYIRSCSQEEDFRAILSTFTARLQARGYPLKFIQKVLATCPPYSERDSLLRPKEKSSDPIVPLVLRYAPNSSAIRQLFPELPPFVKLVYRKNRSLIDFLRTPVRPPDKVSEPESSSLLPPSSAPVYLPR
jgi:hypothetical protein